MKRSSIILERPTMSCPDHSHNLPHPLTSPSPPDTLSSRWSGCRAADGSCPGYCWWEEGSDATPQCPPGPSGWAASLVLHLGHKHDMSSQMKCHKENSLCASEETEAFSLCPEAHDNEKTSALGFGSWTSNLFTECLISSLRSAWKKLKEHKRFSQIKDFREQLILFFVSAI